MSTAITAARAPTEGKEKLKEALGIESSNSSDSEEDEDLDLPEGFELPRKKTLSDWMKLKSEAEKTGDWHWNSTSKKKPSTIKKQKQKSIFKERTLHDLTLEVLPTQPPINEKMLSTVIKCSWKQIFDGKMYNCSNDLTSSLISINKKRKMLDSHPVCGWHLKSCSNPNHNSENSAIEIANENGWCLACYEREHADAPVARDRVPVKMLRTKIPGVVQSNFNRMIKTTTNTTSSNNPVITGDDARLLLTAESICNWKQLDSKHRMYKCTNFVIKHEGSGTFMPQCGFHVSSCLHTLGNKSSCPALTSAVNYHGLCKNHLLALKSNSKKGSAAGKKYGATFETFDSIFTVPGAVRATKIVTSNSNAGPKSHEFAPSTPPPSTSTISSTSNNTGENADITWLKSLPQKIYKTVLYHRNPASTVLRNVLWYITVARKGTRLATRVQKTFRGIQGRKFVKRLALEHKALKRLKATRVLQKHIRASLGRKAFQKELTDVSRAVPFLQRIIRGFLGRQYVHRVHSANVIKRHYKQFVEKIRILRKLQHEAEEERRRALELEAYITTMANVAIFKKRRAIRCMERYAIAWKASRATSEEAVSNRLQRYISTCKIQAWYRRICSQYIHKERTIAAIVIQKRIKGVLTRYLWKDDPGIQYSVSLIKSSNGFIYQKGVLQKDTTSYSFPRKKLRMQFGALEIQRVYRGYVGRLRYNTEWVLMSRRWDYVLGNNNYARRKMHKYLLPSYSYSHLKERHMRLPAELPPNESGFAYEYQDMLDMIEDMSGSRFPSIPSSSTVVVPTTIQEDTVEENDEDDTRRKYNADAVWDYSITSALRASEAPSQPNTHTHNIGMTAEIARIPVGATVNVSMPNNKTHRGKVMSCNVEAETYHITFPSAFISLNGIPVHQEFGVPVSRLSTHLPPNTNVNAGDAMRSSIAEIQDSIDAVKRRDGIKRDAAASAAFFAGDTTTSNRVVATIVPKPTSDAQEVQMYIRIVSDLKNTTKDLTQDPRDLVAYAFQNVYMTQKYWLRMIHDVKTGTISCNDDGISEKPMPDRADVIEKILASVGFRYDPEFCQRPPKVETSKKTTALRKKSSLHFAAKSSLNTHRRESSGTLSSAPPSPSPPPLSKSFTMEDLHSTSHTKAEVNKLHYELQKIPRDIWNESILHDPSRTTRPYVCAIPACGKCFSDWAAARLHQNQVHFNVERLASKGTPETDQYMHKYWPRASPWKKSRGGKKVGYFVCKTCDAEFTIQEELQEHYKVRHPKSLVDPNDVEKNPFLRWIASPVAQDVQHLSKMLKTNAKVPICLLHPTPLVNSCPTCFAQANSPTVPCLAYDRVCLKIDGSLLTNQKNSRTTNVIFKTINDRERIVEMFCPLVRQRPSSLQDDKDGNSSTEVYVKLVTLCLDANSVAWGGGYAYRLPPTYKTRDEELTCGFDLVYELILLDNAPMFFKLSQVVGYARIYNCSQGMFYRKYLASDGIPSYFSKSCVSTLVAQKKLSKKQLRTPGAHKKVLK